MEANERSGCLSRIKHHSKDKISITNMNVTNEYNFYYNNRKYIILHIKSMSNKRWLQRNLEYDPSIRKKVEANPLYNRQMYQSSHRRQRFEGRGIV